MTLSDQDKQYINDLEEFLNFSAQKLSAYNYSISDHKTRKNILYLHLGALQGILAPMPTLLKSEQTLAAQILLRSLFETHLFLSYLFSVGNQSHVIQAIYEDVRRKLKTLNDIKEFTTQYPQEVGGLPSISDIDKKIREYTRLKTKVKKIYQERYRSGSYSWPRNLAELSRMVDADHNLQRPPRSQKHDYERRYITVYDYWSRMAHMDLTGVNTQLQRIETGWVFGADSHEVEAISVSTYAFYFELIHLASRQFGTPASSELKPFADKLTSYRRS
ncbi:hypothetical protein KC644_01485 [Candidatus Berkelbacteria bacterium]|nr:hypothetical protein [Candidatus Berkelbacteria bacterium]